MSRAGGRPPHGGERRWAVRRGAVTLERGMGNGRGQRWRQRNQGAAQERPVVLVIFSITCSSEKLAAFCRGGNSLNVSRNWAT